LKAPQKESTSSAVDGELVGVPRGSFNVCIGVLGAVGSGKSTYAIARAMQYAQQPAYVFAHDLGWKIPETLPDGRPTGVIRHDSIDECVAQLRKDPRGIHCIGTEDAGEIVDLAIATADRSLMANERRGGIPAVVLIDESVSAGDADPYRLGSSLKSAMALRRHKNIGIIWTSQSPNIVHYQMMSIGSELVVFRLKNKRDLTPLMNAGFSEEEIQTITELPDYSYIVHRCT
jgi:hypothetical protein